MQGRRKGVKEFFRSKYVQAFFCYSLMAWSFHLELLLRRRIVADIYLVLNLAVSGVLWFLIGLVISHWVQKAASLTVPAFKITLAVAVLVLFSQAVSAIMALQLGRTAPIVGDWLTYSVTLSCCTSDSLLGVNPPAWANMVAVLITIFLYRLWCFENRENKRLLAICASLAAAVFFSSMLDEALYGGNFRFIAVRRFGNLGILTIYNNALFFACTQCFLFNKNRPVEETESPTGLKAYLRYEFDNARALVFSTRRT